MDITFQRTGGPGSLILIIGATPAGREWLAANVNGGIMWGTAYVSDPGYAWDIYQGALEDGLECGDA